MPVSSRQVDRSRYRALRDWCFAIAGAILFLAGAAPASAGQAVASFTVVADLFPKSGAGPILPAGICRNSSGGAFGATVTVVCSTGTVLDLVPNHPWQPTHGGAFRYVTQVSNGIGLLGTVDIYAGIGTITFLRVISQADREYLEMTVGW